MKEKNIVLFNPAPRSGFQAHRRVDLPLGLLCSAAPLERQGYRVKIIDEFADPRWQKDFSASIAEKPICFGVTCMTGPQILYALKGCAMFKKRHPDVPIVWGGIHSSILPEQTLANKYADIVVVGEGEETLAQLVKALENNTPLEQVKGIAYTKNGQFCFTGARDFVDLDAQPPLPYHLIQMDRYRRNLFGTSHISINSSRGCTFGCAFCWDPVIHKKKWRAMKPQTVLNHIERIVRDYDIRGFTFTDDNFFIDMDRAYRILEGIVRMDAGITLGKLQIRADLVCRMDDDFFRLLKRANVRRFTIGIESGSPRVQKFINKNLSMDTIREANRKLAQYPIIPHYLFMMGLPTETPQEFTQSVRLADALIKENPRAVKSFNIYTPYPGTQLYQEAVRLGLREPQRLTDWAAFNFRNLTRGAAWIEPKMRRLITGMDFSLMFLEKGKFVTPSFRKTNPFVSRLARLYYPIARYRVEHMDARFPIETKIVKALGLFARQD